MPPSTCVTNAMRSLATRSGEDSSSSTPSSSASAAGGPSPIWSGCSPCLLVENLGEHAPLRDRLAERYELVRNEYAEAIRAAQGTSAARLDIDPDLKAIEVIAFLNGLETSWLLNPSIPIERVAEAWATSQRAAMAPLPDLALRGPV